jgi:hypothetical protein
MLEIFNNMNPVLIVFLILSTPIIFIWLFYTLSCLIPQKHKRKNGVKEKKTKGNEEVIEFVVCTDCGTKLNADQLTKFQKYESENLSVEFGCTKYTYWDRA